MIKVNTPNIILVNPNEIEVQKGQYFLVKVRGLAKPSGKLKKEKKIYYGKYDGGWEFEPKSPNIVLINKSNNGNYDTYAWFQAGHFSGTFQIRIYNSQYDGYGETFCTVRVVDQNVQGDIPEIGRSYYDDIEFTSDDNPANVNYCKNPYKVILYKHLAFNDGEGIRLKANDIGWEMPSNNIASIKIDGDNVVVTRGNSYGIVAVKFYLKSNPYIYCPVWIEYNTGLYEDYASYGTNQQASSDVNIPVSGIALNKSSLSLAVGESTRISYTVSPGNATNRYASWSTSDAGVATVDNDGNVTGVTSGIATITARTSDGGYESSCVVTVGGYVKTTGITISPSRITMRAGDIVSVTATVSPSNATNKKIHWQVADGAIGYISVSPDGVVKAFKKITTEIIAKSDDGYTQARATVEVTDNQSFPEDHVYVTGVDLLQNEINLGVGETYSLTYDIRPTSATNRNVTWMSSDTSVATVDSNGEVTGVSKGLAAIYVIADDGGENFNAVYSRCWVSVGGYIRIKNLSISPSSASVEVGESVKFNAVFSPKNATNKNVIWSVPQGAVVTVKPDGTITGVKTGSCFVSVKSEEGENGARVNVTVVAKSSGSGSQSGGSGQQADSEQATTPSQEESSQPYYPVNNDIEEISEPESGTDYIYRIDYNHGEEPEFVPHKLYEGHLGFDLKRPIESVVYQESDTVKKIYWLDGKHVLRFMNFVADEDEIERWNADKTYTCFDSNRMAQFDVNVKISKGNSGSNRPNGVVQYLLTYFNNHGQETGYVWVSDLVYLSPDGRGGSADGANSNSVLLKISNLDTRFTHFRIYSIFRSAFNGTVTSYLVEEGKTYKGEITVVDDGAHLTAQDASRLLYLGSQPLIAGTLEHKDQTLFLGDLQSTGHDYSNLERVIRRNMVMINPGPGASRYVNFQYSDNTIDGIHDIPYVVNEGTYSYENQLKYTSSEITTFKGGEKYRFALKFQLADGTESPAFWIGDETNNDYYPKIDTENNSIKRAIAWCTLPPAVVEAIKSDPLNIKTVQLCIAEATYADRSVKAQGILNPTMFNTWERFNNRLYSIPSWISRPRNAEYASRHFDSVRRSDSSLGEIQCNWWDESGPTPRPYYQYENTSAVSRKYVDNYPDLNPGKFVMVIYGFSLWYANYHGNFAASVTIIKGETKDESQNEYLKNFEFTEEMVPGLVENDRILVDNDKVLITVNSKGFTDTSIWTGWNTSIEAVYSDLVTYLRENNLTAANDFNVISLDRVKSIYNDDINRGALRSDPPGLFHYYNANVVGGSSTISLLECMNSSGHDSSRWRSEVAPDNLSGGKIPAMFSKHVMFVDENVVTLNSPEFDYEAVSVDGQDLRLRIIGVAKINSGYSDYTIDASHAQRNGENVVDCKFSWTSSLGNRNGLLSWPLWMENSLKPKTDAPSETKDRTSSDYEWEGGEVRYWLHMWNRIGNISGYEDTDDGDYGTLHKKVFANMKFSYETIYCKWNKRCYYNNCHPRQFNYTSSQYVYINVGDEKKYYNGNVQMSLAPSRVKYPILYSIGYRDTDENTNANDAAYLYTREPVQIEFLSSPHAVLTLPTSIVGNEIHQEVLPHLSDNDGIKGMFEGDNIAPNCTGALLPWVSEDNGLKTYHVEEKELQIDGIDGNDMYLFVGELYQVYPENSDTRYGGITETDIANCRFIAAGPQFLVKNFKGDGKDVIFGNQGDTYFQRWDCLKTKPFSSGSVNNVVDITSVMVETHVNIDGRTDSQRGVDNIASIDATTFGQLNTVYTQPNNYRIQRDLDDDFNTDAYRSSITWTLPKQDLADVDEWTHITLASSLALDGDKGPCQAIRRFNNSLIAFQDRGISEILFNSRTQLTTQDGVPVEIGNSGKVDGKRYITNHFGCMNKWSITEGKNALYFVDNINKAFCSFGGNGINQLSTKLGFDVWFRSINKLDAWNPTDFDNIVSYYDRVNADVYLVKGSDDDMSCLVYNENLQAFTSFFDYGYVPMMLNIDDRFVSFRNRKLWLQNEGLYCNFFGAQKDYWVQYRVTPTPYTDKIWTNVDYRADFYEVLDSTGKSVVPEEYLINGDAYGTMDDLYKEWETFTDYKVWDEYQTTGFAPFAHDSFYRDDVRKKFRIWRLTIPRALKEGTNRHGMDRIRNPWINLLFRKSGGDNKNLMQLHDIVVKYFE